MSPSSEFCVEESQLVTLRHLPRCLRDFQTLSKMLTVVIATTYFQAARSMVSAMQ